MFFTRTQKDAAKRQMERIVLYKKVFSGEHGSSLLKDLLVRCHIKESTMCKDPYDTAFKEGERSIGLFILSQLGYDLEKLALYISKNENLVNNDVVQ